MNKVLYLTLALFCVLVVSCQQLAGSFIHILDSPKEEILIEKEQESILLKSSQEFSSSWVILPFYRFQDLRFNSGFYFYLFTAYNLANFGDTEMAIRLYNRALEDAKLYLGEIRPGEVGKWYSEDDLCKIHHLETGIDLLESRRGKFFRSLEFNTASTQSSFQSSLIKRTRDLPCITYAEFDESYLSEEDYGLSNFIRPIAYDYFSPNGRDAILVNEINSINSKIDFYFYAAFDLARYQDYEIAENIFEKAYWLSRNNCEKSAIELAIISIEETAYLSRSYEERGEVLSFDDGFSIRYIYSIRDLPCVQLVRSKY